MLAFLALASLISAPSFAANSEQLITLTGSQLVFQTQLQGQKLSSVYRDEDYAATCDRQVPRTVYRYECDHRDVQDCTYIPSSQSCHTVPGSSSCSSTPSCTDTMREVCNSNGCQSFPTRECTTSESCSSTPDREECETTPGYDSCHTRTEDYNCGDRPYTEYDTEYYACTKTRSVYVGTQVDENLVANISVQFKGDLTGLTGKDSFALSLANGTDITRPDLTFKSERSADTHLFKLKTITNKKVIGSPSTITAVYEVEVIPLAQAVTAKTVMVGLDANRGGLILDLKGTKADSDLALDIEIQKDRLLGGLVQVHSQHVYGSNFKSVPMNGGERVEISFNEGRGRDSQRANVCLNRRPHVFKLTLTRKLPSDLSNNLMNPAAVKKIEGTLVSHFEKRIKLSGSEHPQCDLK